MPDSQSLAARPALPPIQEWIFLSPSPKYLHPNNSFATAFDETNDLAARRRPIPSASLSADRYLVIPPARVSTFLVMNSGVSKARTRRSRVQLSKALQETLLDAVAGNIAELPRSHQEQSSGSGDPAGDATPVQARKRRLDAPESEPSPAKRARLTRTDTQQPRFEDVKVEQADETALHQPKPFKHPYAAFLKDFIDPIHPGPGPTSVHTFVSEWLESVGSDRETHCRSDSHLHHSDGVPISRQLIKSAPEMGYIRDVDGFVVPPTPASTITRLYYATEDFASSTASVHHPSYRRNNLNSNNIYIRDSRARLPDYISSHVQGLRAKQRDSPDLLSEQIDGYLDRLDTLAEGCTKADIEGFLEDLVRNILDWGKDIYLMQIRDALDIILEENRKKAAEYAKSRQPPSDGSATTTKHKSLSSRRNSSRSNTVQGPSAGASAAYLEWDETSQHAHEELSCPPQQLQSFVDTGDYTTPQNTDGGLALPEYHYPEDEQQDHGPALASFGLAAEPLAGFLTDPPTEEQPTAAANGYWTWSNSRRKW
ncbi:uncharacterized protein MKZ38_003587 [Zalerion maritima]|uniref:Uncharacterized protein n=1 Tax=Zalerion maritima TaxID=339359 RepID=A0AAD5RMI6_9PEZI|nr:uncharacterized protein MKZ38_003587 [Zalerion maritima]